jgi:N-alpha-acetyltransferase 38, NatC auxiliary subunit
MAEPTPEEALEFLRTTLGLTYRVSIQDGRVFIGNFACIDREKNIVLSNTEEYRIDEGPRGRFVGLVMIPWRWVTKAEVEQFV